MHGEPLVVMHNSHEDVMTCCPSPGLLTCAGSAACCRPGVTTCCVVKRPQVQNRTWVRDPTGPPPFKREVREHAARLIHNRLKRTPWPPNCDNTMLPITADTCTTSRSISSRQRRRPIGWAILAALLLLAVGGRGVAAGDGFCDPLLCVCGARAANCSYRGFLTVPTGLPPLLLTLGKSRYRILLNIVGDT
jgi:hypothetical protein